MMCWLVLLTLLGGWRPGAPMPTPGYGFACAEVAGKVYCIGGVKESMDSIIPRLTNEAYDVMRDSWITGLAPLPGPRWFAGCAALNGKVYVIGGTDGRRDIARVDRYDPNTNTWDTVASLPVPAQALAAAVFDNELYAVGGYCASSDGRYLRSSFRFVPEPGPGHWVRTDSLGLPRASLGLAAAAGRLYAVGGRFFNSTPSIEYYVPDRWRTGTEMRTPRSGHGVVGAGGYVAAIGGAGCQGPRASVELLNCLTGEWLPADSLPAARTFLGVALSGTKVIAIGGQCAQRTLNSVEIADSLLIPSAVAEPKILPRTSTPRVSGTVRAGTAFKLPWPAIVLDAGGRVLFVAGKDETIDVGPGVYFIRPLGQHETCRLTVVK